MALGLGVWVGSWGIFFKGEPERRGRGIWRLRSWTEADAVPCTSWSGHGSTGTATSHSDITPSSVPHYGAWSSYRWFRVAEPAMIPRVESAIGVARAEFQARWYYPADSNRFIGDVLAHAGLSLTPEQQFGLGWIPGFGMYRRPLP